MKRRSKKPLTFLRSRFYGKRVNSVREPLKKDSAGINECWKPSAGASKADLAEYHAEEMGLRRKRQQSRTPNVRQPFSRSIAQGNRNIIRIGTGEPHPHEHKREIARRARQQSRGEHP